MKISVAKFKLVENKGPFKGFADIDTDRMIIHGVALNEREDSAGEFYLSFPAKETQGRDMKKRFYDLITFADGESEDAWHDLATPLVIAEFEKALRAKETKSAPVSQTAVVISDEDIPF